MFNDQFNNTQEKKGKDSECFVLFKKLLVPQNVANIVAYGISKHVVIK
jgi:hypothetical protein